MEQAIDQNQVNKLIRSLRENTEAIRRAPDQSALCEKLDRHTDAINKLADSIQQLVAVCSAPEPEDEPEVADASPRRYMDGTPIGG